MNLLLYLRGAVYKFVWPEFVNRILDQFNKRDEQPPRVRSVNDKPLEQHPGDLLLNGFGVCLRKQVQQTTREIVRVAVRITQLVRDRVEEQIAENPQTYLNPKQAEPVV